MIGVVGATVQDDGGMMVSTLVARLLLAARTDG